MVRSTDVPRESRPGDRSLRDRAAVDGGFVGELDTEEEAAAGSGRDWGKPGAFGAGFALGLIAGVGSALLFAPQSGEETREILGERARRLRRRVVDEWDDLRDEMGWLRRRARRHMRRGLTRGRWMAEDAYDSARHRW